MRKEAGMTLAAIVAAMALVSAAQAAPNPISVDAAKDWRHDLTGTAFPPRIAAFSRHDIADFGNQQLDVMATYNQPETKTTATLYVYRAGLPDASIWHDRIVKVMGMGRLGTADVPHLQTTLFTPAGQGANSGIRSVVPLAGKAYTASGVAVFPHEDWLLVVRMSSETGSAADLDRALAGFVEALHLSPARNPAPEAYGITPCPQPFPEQAAARAARDMTGGLLAGALMQALDDGKGKPAKTAAPHYCSDPAAGVDYGSYRDGQDQARYLVAVGDGGNVVQVAPDTMVALMDPKKSGQYSMMLTTVAKRVSYVPFIAIPSPAQVMTVLQSERPISMTDRPIGASKKKTITISPD